MGSMKDVPRLDGHGAATGDGVGGAPLRKEDQRFLTGKGVYSDDLNLSEQAHAVFVRSPHPHARIVALDKAAALSAAGVLGVLTGADAVAAGIRPLEQGMMFPRRPNHELTNRDGTAVQFAPHPVLAIDTVRYVGQPVAIVVAESIALALDAAELVEVTYDELPHVISAAEAAEDGAPLVWPDAPSNVRVDGDLGDAASADAAMAEATVVVELDTWIKRVTACALEPRAALGMFDPVSGRYTLYCGGGGVHRAKSELAIILCLPEEAIRVVTRDVGGNFGSKNPLYPEYPAVMWAARVVGRPVKWKGTRSESFLSDVGGRDLHVQAQMGLSSDGLILSLKTSNISNIGAHTQSFVPLVKGAELMTGVYDIPVAYVRARGVLTNTPSTYPYRSAGRPEAMFVIERLMDLAALKLGMDRVQIRRRNLVPEKAMPYTNALGLEYDSAAFEQVLDLGLVSADWNGFAGRKTASEGRGMLRGLGLANYIEIAGGNPRERAEIVVRPSGVVDLTIGTVSSGQGHETTFAQLVTEWLGVPIESVRVIAGDTDTVFYGGGTQSGRSMRLAGIVVGKATAALVQTGRRVAAHALRCEAREVDFADGHFSCLKGTRRLDMFDVARLMIEDKQLPVDLQGQLEAIGDEVVREATFPYGCAVCEVEIDPSTGTVRVDRYMAVDDVGQAVNPMIVHGQTHGGIAQGVGQALMEQCSYDPESGQLLSGSFMDYAIPRADDLPSFVTAISEVRSPSNPLGIRGGGEGGTTPALAVMVSAVVDALAPFGVTHMEMPLTCERVWRAIHERESIQESA